MAGSYCGISHEKEAKSAVICSDSSQYEGTFCVLQLAGCFRIFRTAYPWAAGLGQDDRDLWFRCLKGFR